MLKKRFTALVLSFTAVVPGIFAARFDDKVRTDFFTGLAGDSAALERAMKLSAEAIAEDPSGSAEALAWHGAGLLFLAGQKFRQGDTASGGEMWERANGEMDKAGAMAPDNPSVLIPRAAAWFAASRFSPPQMGNPLIARAVADYEHVYDLQKAYFDTLGVHPRSELLFGLADGYSRLGNDAKARGFFEKLAAIGPASGHLEQAKLYLDGQKYNVRGVGCAGCHTGK